MWVGFVGGLWEGLLEAANIAGGWRFAIDRSEKTLGELPPVRFDRDWQGDGLIVFRMSKEEASTWRKAEIPVVNLSSEGPAGGFPRIIPDNVQAGRVAAEHLADTGLAHFAYVGRQTSIHADGAWASGTPRIYSKERLKGFRETLKKRGHPVHCHILKGRPLSEEGCWKDIEKEISEFLATLPRHCGVFAADDGLALVVMRTAHRMGLKIPQDLAVLGFGNDPEFCFTALPPLSSVAYPGKAVGLHAASTLTDMMAGKKVPKVVRVAVTTIVERGSSSFIPIEDPVVTRLLTFIREQAPKRPLQVAELPDLTPWGTTTVKKKIRAILGHGAKEEIKRVRLARLKELLSATDLVLTEISTNMGFGSPQDMSRFFARETGLTPSDFRTKVRSRPNGS